MASIDKMKNICEEKMKEAKEANDILTYNYLRVLSNVFYTTANTAEECDHKTEQLNKLFNKLSNYYLVNEELCSGEDSQTGMWIVQALDEEDIYDYWRNIFDMPDEANQYETNSGNIYQIESIKKIPKSDFKVLRKYLEVHYTG